MSKLEDQPLVQAYLDQVCAQVRAKVLHSELRLELLDHLRETAEDSLRDGMDEEEASRPNVSSPQSAEPAREASRPPH